MKEKEIKKIMKQSIVSPSNGFTDDLMKRINAETEAAVKIKRTIILVCLGCIAIFVLSFMFNIPELSYMDFTLKIPPIFIQMICVSFILYELYQLREIYQRVMEFKNSNK